MHGEILATRLGVLHDGAVADVGDLRLDVELAEQIDAVLGIETGELRPVAVVDILERAQPVVDQAARRARRRGRSAPPP